MIPQAYAGQEDAGLEAGMAAKTKVTVHGFLYRETTKWAGAFI